MVSQAGVRNYESTGWAAGQTQRKWGNVKLIQLLCATDHRACNCPFLKRKRILNWFWTERGFSGTDAVVADSFDPLQRRLRMKEALLSLRYRTWGLMCALGGNSGKDLTSTTDN